MDSSIQASRAQLGGPMMKTNIPKSCITIYVDETKLLITTALRED